MDVDLSFLEDMDRLVLSEPLPAELTPESATLEGAVRLEVKDETNNVFVKRQGDYVDIYDFTAGEHTRIRTESAAAATPVMFRSDFEPQIRAVPSFSTDYRPALLLADDEKSWEDIASEILLGLERIASQILNWIGIVDTAYSDVALNEQKLIEEAKANWDAWNDPAKPYNKQNLTARDALQMKLNAAKKELAAANEAWRQHQNWGYISDYGDDIGRAIDEHVSGILNEKELKLLEDLNKAEAKNAELEIELEQAINKIDATEAAAAAKAKRAEETMAKLGATATGSRYNQKLGAIARLLARGKSALRSVSLLFHKISETRLFRIAGRLLGIVDICVSVKELFDNEEVYLNEIWGYAQDRQGVDDTIAKALTEYMSDNMTGQQYAECIRKGNAMKEDIDDCLDSLDAMFYGVIVNASMSVINFVGMFLKAPIVAKALILANGATGYWNFGSQMLHRYNCAALKDSSDAFYKACAQRKEKENEHKHGPDPFSSPALHDPAGVVYEAVLSNALEGATAKIYYRADDGSETLWDAENYGQLNPQTTDAQGGYMWMTPEGQWKVRVTLDGYADGNSENDPVAVDGWLPVLPPQIHVNIPMVADAEATQEIAQADTVIAATDHAWGDWTQTLAPTETEKGEEQRVCANDPSHVQTRELPALGVPSYAITVGESENGTVSTNVAAAAAGDTVTVTAAPHEGYELESITYTPEGGEAVDVTASGSFTMPAVPVMVTVRFKRLPPPVTLRFDAGGGSAVEAQSVAYGESAARPTDPTRDGYRFDGWFEDATLLVPFDFATPVTADATVYAKWTQTTPTAYVIYDGAGGVWTRGSETGLTVTVKRSLEDASCFSHFTGVKLDGALLANGTDYTAVAGSTVVTLAAAALQRLAAGSHTLTVLFDDGSVDTTLTVKDPAPAPTAAPAPST